MGRRHKGSINALHMLIRGVDAPLLLELLFGSSVLLLRFIFERSRWRLAGKTGLFDLYFDILRLVRY